MIESRGQFCESQVGPSDDGDPSRSPSSTTTAAPLDPGAALAKLRTKFQELCYGIPIDLIAQWCCVDLKTARHYKSGTRSPGKSALVLFMLHRNGLVLPAEWQGFSFRDGTMWDPSGKPLTHGMLRAYELGIQLMREWARGNNRRTRTLDQIFYAAAPGLASSAAWPASGATFGPSAEAKPSALVLQPAPETIRTRKLRARTKLAGRRRPETGSTKVVGRDQRATGNAKRGADSFSMLSPELRAAANAGAKR
jgi:hypothetical protein